ncbi:MAG: hypothetical protein PHT54_01325 [Candidatus Nanoarchaeia archaeon]|nr:hypothetical protein [Candidatus Nanoarchaeia archaeon]
MAVVGFNFDKILVEKKKVLKGDIKVKNNLDIKNIKEESMDLGDSKQKLIKFEFKFTVEYEPSAASIEILGHILYTESDDKIKKILDDWKKKKDVDMALKTRLVNMALTRCNIKALALTQDVNLPPHIRLPMVSPKVDKTSYIG